MYGMSRVSSDIARLITGIILLTLVYKLITGQDLDPADPELQEAIEECFRRYYASKGIDAMEACNPSEESD